MQVEIYINEQKLDTDTSTKIAETKQINDFFELRDRQTSYTNSFRLPITEKNKKILGGMSIIGNTSIAPYRIHKVSVYRNGIQTIANGIGYFKTTNNHFNMFVYSENIDLFDKMGDKSLADLNLSNLNHDLNIESWLNSFTRKDYTYAVADYGKTDQEIEVNYQVPALYVAFLWSKIFAENGFKWRYYGRGNQNDYNPFLTDEWKSIAITIDEGFPTPKQSVNPEKKLELSKIKTSQFKGATINYFGNQVVVQDLTGHINEYVRFITDFDADGIHVFSNSTQYNRSRIRVKESGFYKININGIFYNHNTENASIFIEKDGYNLFTVKEDISQGQSNFGFSNKLYLREGEELFVKVSTLPKNNESYYSYDIKLELWLDNTVTSVNFSSYLSKIKQKDFFKDVLQYFGLVFRRKEDTYEFRSIEELLDPLAVYANYDAHQENTVLVDWSKKFNRIVSVDTKVGNYAKNNLFRYKYDNPEDTFANSVLKIDDQTLPTETTLIERPYRAPDRSTVSIAGQLLRKCSFYQKEFDDDGTLKSVKAKKAEPYFFKVKHLQTSIKYKLAGATSSNTYTGIVPFMVFDDLDFNNVLPNRYAAFANMVNYGKKYTVELYLTETDIHTLDFFKLIYLKQLGGLFYLNKVSNFSGSGKTKVELIQVRAIEKLGQFSDDFNNDFNT